MIISNKHKLCFIHIQKCGGVSMTQMIKNLDPSGFKYGQDPIVANHTHNDVAECLHSPYKDYFKFVTIRNPFAIIVSRYFFSRKMYARPKYNIKIPEYADHREPFKRYVLDEFWPEYLSEAARIRHRSTPYKWNYEGKEHSTFVRGFAPLYTWMIDNKGENRMDLILRLENMAEDIVKLENHVGKKLPIQHSNKTDHRNYQYYYDDETRAVVEKHYAKDLELFNYSYE